MKKTIKWRAILSLILIVISTVMNWWLWGILLIIWGLTNLLGNETWLSETIRKSENPILFYLVIGIWLFFGFYYVADPVTRLMR